MHRYQATSPRKPKPHPPFQRPPYVPGPAFVFRAAVINVIDADTLDLYIDCGFHTFRRDRIRLLGVDAWETKGTERSKGKAAMTFVLGWLMLEEANQPFPYTLSTYQSDAFGRYLGVLWRPGDAVSLNDALIAAGHAVPYPRAVPIEQVHPISPMREAPDA